MKKLLSVAFAAFVGFGFIACGEKGEKDNARESSQSTQVKSSGVSTAPSSSTILKTSSSQLQDRKSVV